MVLAGVGLLVLGCEIGSESTPAQRVEHTFTFEQTAEAWGPLFADYPANADTTGDGMALTFGHRALPGDVPEGNGLYLSGRNTSDDLFMGLRRSLSGLAPSTRYDLTVEMTLASAAPSNCVGIGGPPGEGVWVKAGGAARKPTRRVDEAGWYRLTVDKGGQSQGGDQARVLGTIANGTEQCSDPPYRLIERAMDEPLSVTTNDNGTLWLLVGTDSGFEGTTGVYYDEIRVTLTPQ